MKNFSAVLVPLIASGLALILFFGLATMNLNNACVSQETALTAAYEDSQVQYDKFWKTVKEQAQISDKYAADFKAVFLGSIDGRYAGKDPAVQLIMEANPALSVNMYQQLARTVEAGRNDFARTQRTIIDRKRGYKKTLGSFPASMVASRLGYPTEVTGTYAPTRDADGDGRITVLDYESVTSGKTQGVFQTGIEDQPLDVFGAAAPPAPAPPAVK